MEKINLIDYLDKKVKKWWNNPEVTNALLEDRHYHLSHLELERVGSLTMTSKNCSSPREGYQSSEISVSDFYQEKYGIELKHPEMPLFTCDDGLDVEYPAEVIFLEIPISTKPPIQEPLTIENLNTETLSVYLTKKFGEDWAENPQDVRKYLKDIDFYLTFHGGMHYGSLSISSELPTTKMEYGNDIIPFHEYFEKVHNYEMNDYLTPLITVNPMDRKKFHWPAELIFIVLY